MTLIIQIIPILLAIPGFVIISLSRDNKPALWIGINHRIIVLDFDTEIKRIVSKIVSNRLMKNEPIFDTLLHGLRRLFAKFLHHTFC